MEHDSDAKPEEEIPLAPEALGKGSVKTSSKDLVPFDPLQRYLKMVRDIPRLTPEEEHQLALKVQKENDQEAALRLVTANLYVVVSIAFEFRSQFQQMLDLIQEGNIGLMRAVKRFDPFRGVRLPTYAGYWVRAYIIKYLLDNWRLVRVGTTNARRKLLFNLNRVTEQLKAEGIDPGPKRLAEHFDVSEEDVKAVQRSLGSFDISMDATVADDSSRTYADVIGEEAKPLDDTLGDAEISELVKKHVDAFAATLRDAERSILFSRLMSDEPLTLAEIGEQHGVTREAIRQSEVRLIKKLKEYLEEKLPGIADFQFVPSKKSRRF